MKYICKCWVGAAVLLLSGLMFLSASPVWAATYEYDELNRLTKIIYDSGDYIKYEYDAAGNIVGVSSSDIPPVAQCQNVTVQTDSGVCTAEVSVDAGSYDPDGDPITIVQNPEGPYSLGTTNVTLTATDDRGASDSCTATVTVMDQEYPNIASINANPNVLWPSNHKMVPVTVSISSSDNCDTNPICKITSVSSNEPDNGSGDDNTIPDWEITGDLTLNLRAERSGTGSGRIYTFTVTCTDDSKNSSTGTVIVTVPHDKGKK
jgi:YD repeat-containing protein